MSDSEKKTYLELNSKIDNFLEQKAILLETLSTTITLTYKIIVLKNKINIKLMVKQNAC